MSAASIAKVSAVADELTGGRIKARRLALGLSLRGMADEARVHRNTVTKIEAGEEVDAHKLGQVLATLDRLEHRYGIDDPAHVVNVIELPDGSRVTFTGSPEGVAEAAARFLASRTTDE